jgi:hypothetical protein
VGSCNMCEISSLTDSSHQQYGRHPLQRTGSNYILSPIPTNNFECYLS